MRVVAMAGATRDDVSGAMSDEYGVTFDVCVSGYARICARRIGYGEAYDIVTF